MISGCMFSSLCLLFIIVHIRASKNDCTELPSCGPLAYNIKFPFRLRDRQSSKCGYPGFDLSCTVKNETVLQLPNTQIKLYVAAISYHIQRIVVVIPDYYGSSDARRSLELLNLSKTPFRFDSEFYSFAMMNCSDQNLDLRPMLSRNLIGYYFINCTKMYSYKKPLDPEYNYDYFDTYSGYFSLTWSIPSCEPCRHQSKACRLKKNTTIHETECYDWPNQINSDCRLKKNTLNHETECYYDHHYEQTISKGPIKSIVTAVSTIGSFLVLITAIATLYVYTSDKKEKENRQRIEKFLEDYIAFKPSRYTYADIKKITDQFKIKLGQGAYGTVFKGKLSNEIFVAVKILSNMTKGDGGDFVNEVSTMGRIHHVNVARLVGYCADGYRRALVYEFFPNDSLDKYISSKTQLSLSWERLRAIALGIAKGIDYLHQGCDQRILHFDIKPHNILLDQNFTPKICDFGLAKLCSKDQSIVSMTATRGTMGYIAPEVFSRNFGNVSCKSDVYSFGMLLLEMVGGRKNTSESATAEEIYYPEWIYNLLEEGEDLRIQIEEEGDAIIAKRLAIVGLWCIQWHPIGRPSMKVVVQMLEGSEDLIMSPNPFVSTSSNSAMSNNIIPVRRVAFELEAIAE